MRDWMIKTHIEEFNFIFHSENTVAHALAGWTAKCWRRRLWNVVSPNWLSPFITKEILGYSPLGNISI